MLTSWLGAELDRRFQFKNWEEVKNLVESTARGSAEVKKSPNFGEDCIIGETARIGAKP